jgi:hypothetical protein
MVNKKIIILFSSLLVLDNCIYASEGDKSDDKILEKRSRSLDSSDSVEPAKKLKSLDDSGSEDLDLGSSESEVSEDEINWEETAEMRLLSGIIERNSLAISTALKDGANPNFIYFPKSPPVDPQGYEDRPMLEVALEWYCSSDILKNLIEAGASLDVFKNPWQMNSFLRQAGEKTTEDALFILNKILESGVEVRPSCLNHFLLDCPRIDSCSECRGRFIDTLLRANPSCANQSSINNMCSKKINPGLRCDSSRYCFSNACFDSDCKNLENTLTVGNLDLSCLSPHAEENALASVKRSIKSGKQDNLKSCPNPPALFSLLFARLCHNPKHGSLGSSAKVIKQFEKSCRDASMPYSMARIERGDLYFLNCHKALMFLPNSLKRFASNEMLRLKCLFEASSRLSYEIVDGKMQLVVSGYSSALKRSSFGMNCTALLLNKDFEKIYKLMLQQGSAGSLNYKIDKLLLSQCIKCLESPDFSAIAYLLAHGRCLNLLENRSVGDAACGDGSRVAVASAGRLPVQAGGGDASHFGIGGRSFAQAVGGDANPFSFKRNLFLEDAPEKGKKSKEEDQDPK